MSDYVGMDLVSLVEMEAGISLEKKANHYQFGDEYWGPCPFCRAGDNRFHVWINCSRPHYWCRVCDTQGSAPWFLVQYRHMTYSQALQALGLESGHGVTWNGETHKGEPPCKDWQGQAELYVEIAQELLWQPRGAHALDYLRRRGFTDEIIRTYKLGYMPSNSQGEWYKIPSDVWGIPITNPEKPHVTLWEGILIPWYVGNTLWKLEVRKLKDDGLNKLPSVKGSRESLYNVNALRAGMPIVLVESAFCALSGMQECGDMAVFLATGGTKKARYSLWLECLRQAPCVLVAFDNDEPDEKGQRAGEEGAKYWCEHLSNAIRAYPRDCDVNDMLMKKRDLRAWLANELEGYELSQQRITVPVVVAPAPAQQEEPGPARLCCQCESRPADREVDGLPYCEKHYPLPAEQPQKADDVPASFLHFAETVARIVDVLGGPEQVRIDRLPRGLTLEQYARTTLRKPYVPRSLPPLPRTACPYQGVKEEQGRLKAAPCKGKPLAHGWCEQHQHAHTFLCLGAVLGYPAMQLGLARILGAGVLGWEAYAECTAERWLKEDIPAIRRHFNYHEPLNLAIPPDVKTTREPAKQHTLVQEEEEQWAE